MHKASLCGQANSSKGLHHPGLGSGFLFLLPVPDSPCEFVEGTSQSGIHSVSHLELQELRLQTLLEPSVLQLAVGWLGTLDLGLASNLGSAFSDV